MFQNHPCDLVYQSLAQISSVLAHALVNSAKAASSSCTLQRWTTLPNMPNTRYIPCSCSVLRRPIYIYLPQVWIKPNGEMPFLYGNHVVKAHLGRITEDTPEHQGVVVFSMKDIPLVRKLTSGTPHNLPTAVMAGFWSNRAINGRHAKTRPDVHNRFPPSVRSRVSLHLNHRLIVRTFPGMLVNIYEMK